MSDNESEKVVARRMAMIGKVLAIQVPPGTQIFCPHTGNRLGIVADRLPVYNMQYNSVYLSTDDWLAAEATLPPSTRH